MSAYETSRDGVRKREARSRAKGLGVDKSIGDRRRGAPMARREEGAYWLYVTDEQRSQRGWIGGENDRIGHSQALRERVRSPELDGQGAGVRPAQPRGDAGDARVGQRAPPRPDAER